MNNSILSNKEWKESDYGNPLNTTTDSFFKAHDERNIKKGNELRQMQRKGDNKNDEQPIKRVMPLHGARPECETSAWPLYALLADVATCNIVKKGRVRDNAADN
ncbi:hypothetical protein Tco_0609282 [Tanacetum coccineum]